MKLPTGWTWVWVNSRSWWWTGRPGVLRFTGSQRVGYDWATELNEIYADVLARLETAISHTVIGEKDKGQLEKLLAYENPSQESQKAIAPIRETGTLIDYLNACYNLGASLMAQRLKRLPAMRKMWVRFLGWEDPLEKEMATHSSILAWRTPWTEEPGGLQSTGSQRVRHDCSYGIWTLSCRM